MPHGIDTSSKNISLVFGQHLAVAAQGILLALHSEIDPGGVPGCWGSNQLGCLLGSLPSLLFSFFGPVQIIFKGTSQAKCPILINVAGLGEFEAPLSNCGQTCRETHLA